MSIQSEKQANVVSVGEAAGIQLFSALTTYHPDRPFRQSLFARMTAHGGSPN